MHTATKKVTHIFVSFTGALRALKEGRVDAKDLRYGLFYFRSSKEYAYSQEAQTRVEEKFYWTLVTALDHAKQEERIQWRKILLQQKESNSLAITIGLRGNTYGELNELMVKHGLQPMRYRPGDTYSFDGIEERVHNANSYLTVTY